MPNENIDLQLDAMHIGWTYQRSNGRIGVGNYPAECIAPQIWQSFSPSLATRSSPFPTDSPAQEPAIQGLTDHHHCLGEAMIRLPQTSFESNSYAGKDSSW